MKNVKRLIKCLLICLASVCLYMVDDCVCEEDCGRDSRSGRTASPSVTFERSSFSLSASALQRSIPRNSTSSNSLRTSFQSQRQNSTNSSRTGFTMVKAGKSMNEYSTSSFHRSIANFPSGMKEDSHRLIGLGKLII